MNKRIVEDKIQEIVQKIVEKFDPEKIVLFGSWAWGSPGEDSDVDLFIVKETENTRSLAREIDGLIFPRPFPLDIVVYRSKQAQEKKNTDFFLRQILTKGKVLYAK